MQGQYLKEVSASFLLLKPLNLLTAKDFLFKLAKALNVKIVSSSVNHLPPGFDIIFGIKESMIYLGYWAEVKLVRIHAFSCKRFDDEIITQTISEHFKIKGKVLMELQRDKPISEEVEECLLRI